jgi:hypothetical protein
MRRDGTFDGVACQLDAQTRLRRREECRVEGFLRGAQAGGQLDARRVIGVHYNSLRTFALIWM